MKKNNKKHLKALTLRIIEKLPKKISGVITRFEMENDTFIIRSKDGVIFNTECHHLPLHSDEGDDIYFFKKDIELSGGIYLWAYNVRGGQ